MMNSTLSKFKVFALQKTLLIEGKDILGPGRKYLQSTYPTNSSGYMIYVPSAKGKYRSFVQRAGKKCHQVY